MTNLPDGWSLVALRDMGDWFGGGTPSKSRPDFWHEGTVPWLSPKDMGPDVLSTTRDKITESAVVESAVRRIPAGSVAIVVRSGILERTVPVAWVPFEATLNQDMKAIVPRQDIDARWIAWGLRADEPRILRELRKSGTTVASLDTKRLFDFKLPIPPLDEQHRIVAILEDHLSRLDVGQALLHAVRRRSKVLKTEAISALLDAAHPGGSTVRLADIAEVRLGRQRSPKNHTGERMRPYLRAANVDWEGLRLDDVKEMNFTEEESAVYELRPGDLLLSEASGSPSEVGKPVIYNGEVDGACFQNTLVRVRVADPSRTNPHFIYWTLFADARSGRFSRASRGVGIHHLGAKALYGWPVSLPDSGKQDRAVGAIEELTSSLHRSESVVDTANVKAQVLRQSLLRAAFTGSL